MKKNGSQFCQRPKASSQLLNLIIHLATAIANRLLSLLNVLTIAIAHIFAQSGK